MEKTTILLYPALRVGRIQQVVQFYLPRNTLNRAVAGMAGQEQAEGKLQLFQ